MKFEICKSKLLCVFLSSLIGVISFIDSAIAAEKLIFKFNIFEEALSVGDLRTFSKVDLDSPQLDKTSSQIKNYLKKAGFSPSYIQRILSQEIPADIVLMDRILNNPLSEIPLDQIGAAIYTSNTTTDRQALRSAILMATTQPMTQRISILKIIENHPAQEIYVDIYQLNILTRKFSGLIQQSVIRR